MERFRIHIFIAVILVLSVALACNTNSTGFDGEEGMRQLSELEKMMDVQFPFGSKIVYAESNGRNNESYISHIVYSPTPVGFNRRQTPPKTPVEDSFEILKIYIKKNFGKLKDKWTYHYEGTVGNGEWSASQTNFETGSYLDVQQIFLGEKTIKIKKQQNKTKLTTRR